MVSATMFAQPTKPTIGSRVETRSGWPDQHLQLSSASIQHTALTPPPWSQWIAIINNIFAICGLTGVINAQRDLVVAFFAWSAVQMVRGAPSKQPKTQHLMHRPRHLCADSCTRTQAERACARSQTHTSSHP